MKSEVKIIGQRLQLTRVFDAPRAVVFGWWSEAEKLQQWSGCKETTKCEVEMDFRVGGSFTQKMHIDRRGRLQAYRNLRRNRGAGENFLSGRHGARHHADRD